MSRIPFNRPHIVGTELRYIAEANENGHLSGNGPFSQACTDWLAAEIGCSRALLTHSCTGALEMAAILAGLEPGDEVIMPSFAFVSTANAAVLRGATPVFVDIRPDTLNLDESLIEDAITSRTKAIMVVHYAGVGCAMDEIDAVARRRGLVVIEDAAQGMLAFYRGRPLGGFGQLSALSFHETKNVHCGEGGALLVNEPQLVERAEVVHEKGTDRSRFFRGEIDKYTWVDIGSSYLLSDISAAFLWGQLEQAASITRRRLEIWEHYHQAFEPLERAGLLRRPVVPTECTHNGHIYYVLLPSVKRRDAVLHYMNQHGVQAVFHYIPLHSAPAGELYGRVGDANRVATDASGRLIRLPLWIAMSESEVVRVTDTLAAALDDADRRVAI